MQTHVFMRFYFFVAHRFISKTLILHSSLVHLLFENGYLFFKLNLKNTNQNPNPYAWIQITKMQIFLVFSLTVTIVNQNDIFTNELESLPN